MFTLSLRSLRYRAGAYVSTFLSMFFGAVILMSFGSLFDTSGGAGVDAASRSTLTTMAGVVGGWSLLLVTFAVTSMLALQIRQRAEEMALLKHIGATPAQVTWMIVAEAMLLAVLAVAAAVTPAVFAGRWLFSALVENGQVDPGVAYRFGGFAIHLGVGVTVVAATVAALAAARRATRRNATEALVEAATGTTRMSRKRIAAAGLFLFLGADLAVVTATVMRGTEGFDAMATAGPAAIWFSIGLALLAPALVRATTARLAGPLERLGGVTGQLAGLNLRQGYAQLSTAAMPIILFTGIATGTLYMTSTDNAARIASGAAKTIDHRNAETTNLIVVCMILLFAAIMVVNTLVASTTGRIREFGQQRLAGATPGQVLRIVASEATVLAATGVLFGSIAALFTVVPFAIARSTGPAGGVTVYLGVAATAGVLTLVTTVVAARRTIRTPAVDAVAA